MEWAPAIIGVAGYGCVRAGVVVWMGSHGGLPSSMVGWSGAVSALAAAGQAFTLAVLLPNPRRGRQAFAWVGAAAALGAAVIDAGLWVAIGSAAEPSGYAWQMVLAVLITIASMLRASAGFRSVRRAEGRIDLVLANRLLLRIVAAAVVVAAAAGVAVLLVDQPHVVDRLLGLVAVTGLACAISAIGGWLLVVGELRHRRRQLVLAQMYDGIDNRPGSAGVADDE